MVEHARTGSAGRKQKGAVLLVALLLLVAITVLTTTAVTTGIMELRMASNMEAASNTFQTAVAAVDFVISDPDNLPTVGPLNIPTAVTLTATPFSTTGNDSVTASATRTDDCALPPRMTNATSILAYSAFNYEIASEILKNDTGMGQSSMLQGYILLGPKC
jgi:hypothetical protein